jgi:hypothetical protein
MSLHRKGPSFFRNAGVPPNQSTICPQVMLAAAPVIALARSDAISAAVSPT